MRSQELYFLFSPVTRLKGVGPNFARALGRLLYNDEARMPLVRDLLFHLPTALIDRRFTSPLVSAPEGVIATFVVRVESHQPPPNKYGRRTPYRVYCSNQTGDLTLVFFHAKPDYLQQALPVGQEVVISGRTEKFDYRLQMTHPDIIAPVSELAQVQRQEPLYNLTANLTNRRLVALIQAGLENVAALPEWLEPALVEKHRWAGWKESLIQAHAPLEEADLSPEHPARMRLAYDELLANQLYLAGLRAKTRTKSGHVIPAAEGLAKALRAKLPFALTLGQEDAIREIGEDMASGKRMVRLLQGDVGSGKTLVALISMLRVVENGGQAALMVPTGIIAQQHYNTLAGYAESIGVRVALLTGNIKGAARQEILRDLAGGEISLLVGTHALFQEKVEFKDLKLAVIDEQHRFGVEQRMALAGKGENPHLLHMTATPIPRSLMLTLYGDMDASILTEKPAGRQPIVTRVIPLSRYAEMMEGLARALAKGEKIYWICPLIEDEVDLMETGNDNAANDIAAAEFRYKEFHTRFGDKVGMVHGRMKPDERHAVMRKFAGGGCDLLVATTVVEVGVDVKDATIMVIERAERFGLSQLHQLRGRVGRSDKPSSCVLLYSDQAGEPARQRLSLLRDTEDGFEIADADLMMRGGGEVMGTRQSGLPAFTFADITKHGALIRQAREEAKHILAADPALSGPRGQALKVLLGLFEYATEPAALPLQEVSSAR